MAHDKGFACILFHIKSVDKMETLLIIGGKSVNYVLYRRKNNRRTMTILLRSQPNEDRKHAAEGQQTRDGQGEKGSFHKALQSKWFFCFFGVKQDGSSFG